MREDNADFPAGHASPTNSTRPFTLRAGALVVRRSTPAPLVYLIHKCLSGLFHGRVALGCSVCQEVECMPFVKAVTLYENAYRLRNDG